MIIIRFVDSREMALNISLNEFLVLPINNYGGVIFDDKYINVNTIEYIVG